MTEHYLPPEAEDFLASQASPSTICVYRREITALLRHVHKPLQDIQCRDLIAYRRALSGLKPSTVSRKLSTIRSLFQFLVEAGYRDDNPAQVLRLPKSANTSPYRVLGVDELRKLFDQPAQDTPIGVRDRAMLMLLAINGLRESELINIDLEDVSPRAGFTVAIIRGKGSKVRLSKIAGSVESVFNQWSRMLPHASGPVFVAVKGKRVTNQRLSSRSVRYGVTKYARRAGITRKVSPHALRHAAITHSLANGANILKVKEMAGHASLSTTQRYLHNLEALADNAVDYNPLTRL